jgi:ketosteroid isomerase-like protein
MKTVAAAAAAALLAAALYPPAASAGITEEVIGTYQAFAAAQNARDLARVRALLIDSPKFLWVTDGMAVWGPDATLERMALFQRSEIWEVVPALDRSRVVDVAPDTAFLTLPLTLRIGSREPGPDQLRFLVNVLCVKKPEGWRIAALFTTTDKSP